MACADGVELLDKTTQRLWSHRHLFNVVDRRGCWIVACNSLTRIRSARNCYRLCAEETCQEKVTTGISP